MLFRSTHPKVCSYDEYLKIGVPDDVRFIRCNTLNNGGWHLSYFGDINFIINKLKNFAHTEFNTEESTNPENILEKISTNKDLFGRDGFMDFNYINIEENNYLPKKYKMLL